MESCEESRCTDRKSGSGFFIAIFPALKWLKQASQKKGCLRMPENGYIGGDIQGDLIRGLYTRLPQGGCIRASHKGLYIRLPEGGYIGGLYKAI